MTSVRSSIFMIALALVLGPIAPVARGDTLTLVDGRQFEGEVIEENSREVKIKARQGAIVTTLTFKRYQVASIEKGAVSDKFLKQDNHEEAEPDERDSASAGDDAIPGDADAMHYMLIPIYGVMGEEAFAGGIEKALARAKRSGIEHIVFDLDTPGGFLVEARAMVDVINEFRSESRRRGRDVILYAYVRRAISAGIWVMFSCDQIYFDRNGTAGGAVGYTTDRSTGAAEVDAKMNSIVAAELASSAETLGHDGKIVRAMIIMDAELWAAHDASGTTRFLERKPSVPGGADSNIEELDSDATVLTLTASQAERLGIAKIVPDGPEKLGGELAIEGWAQAGTLGHAAMAQAKREATRAAEKQAREVQEAVDLAEELDDLNKNTLPKLIERAGDLDPANDRYTVFRDSGVFTGESMQRWRNNHDRCIGAWRDVLKVLKKMDRKDKRFKQITGESFFVRSSGRMVVGEVDDIIDQLFRNRSKVKP